MVTRKEKLIFLLLLVTLAVFSAAVIAANGRTYTLRTEDFASAGSLEELTIEIEGDGTVIECTEQSFEDGVLEVKVRSVGRGKGYIDVLQGENTRYYPFYVHRFGIITFMDYLGKFSGDIVIPLSGLILLIAALFISIAAYRRGMAVSMYQYRNVALLGLIIFLSFAVIDQATQLVGYGGLLDSVNSLQSSAQLLSFVLLPLAFIASVVMTVSSVILIRREGYSWQNLLGVILGLFLLLLTFLPEIVNYMMYWTPLFSWIDVHRENGLATHILKFVDTSVYGIVAYLECILIATIILALKAARHIPAFDKDYILILGCMIRKDGSLTPLLQSRTDRAIEFAKMQKEKTGKSIAFVPSGGQGSDEVIPEARAIRNYLVDQGIPEEQILVEDRSANTEENMLFSRALIGERTEDPKIAFSTTNYHVFRSGLLAFDQGIDAEGIGAKTKRYFSLNAFVREFIATLVSERKLHVMIVVILLLLAVLFNGLIYYSHLHL